MEITDITGALKTTFILDGADAGVNRLVWDLRFDPPASTAKNIGDNLKKQIDGALLRKDISDENKAILTNAAHTIPHPQPFYQYSENQSAILSMEKSRSVGREIEVTLIVIH